MQQTIKPELIAIGEPQTIAADLTRFNKAKEQVALTVTELQKYVAIGNKETLELAMSTLKIASKVEKAIENKRKDLVKPFNDGASAINAHAKEIIAGLPQAIDDVKKACLLFQKEEEEKAAKIKRETRTHQLLDMGLEYDEAARCFVLGDVRVHSANLHVEDLIWQQVMNDTANKLVEQEAAKAKALLEDDELFDLLGDDSGAEEIVQQSVTATTKIEEARYSGAVAMAAPTKLAGAAKVWKFKITDPSLVPREYLTVDETLVRRAVAGGSREIPGVEIYQEDQLRIR